MTDTDLPTSVLDAHRRTLRDLLEHGEPVGKKRPAVELIGYTTGMSNARARLVQAGGSVQNVVGAVARFVWLVAGNDRLEDIAFYEKRVRDFTDNGLTVPGSSYGRRLFDARPGLNQIAGVVAELRDDPNSRRAAAVVWTPEDAVRHSNDIPCTFGLFFHIRDGALRATTAMRSNNAFTLLPYNFFEFSMLAEMVAAELNVPLGRYDHWAASMHVFPQDRIGSDTGPTVQSLIDKLLRDTTRDAVTMPAMPTGAALQHAQTLGQLEAALRHAPTKAAVDEVASRAATELPPYWLAFFQVLHAFVLAKRQEPAAAAAVAADLPEHFRSGVETSIAALASAATPTATETPSALFELEALERPAASAASAVDASLDVDLGWLAEQLAATEVDGGAASVAELLTVQRQLRARRSDLGLAARSGPGTGLVGPDPFTREEIAQELRRARGQHH